MSTRNRTRYEDRNGEDVQGYGGGSWKGEGTAAPPMNPTST
jgi:hypothetical protein